jgi:hypothetical protein
MDSTPPYRIQIQNWQHPRSAFRQYVQKLATQSHSKTALCTGLFSFWIYTRQRIQDKPPGPTRPVSIKRTNNIKNQFGCWVEFYPSGCAVSSRMNVIQWTQKFDKEVACGEGKEAKSRFLAPPGMTFAQQLAGK